MRRLFAALVLAVGLSALPAWSQVNEVPRFDISGGFSHVTGDIGLNGWQLGAAYRVNNWLAIAGDFAGQYGSNDIVAITGTSLIKVDRSLYNYMFGPRVFVPLAGHPRWMPFGEFLLGASRGKDTLKSTLLGSVVIPGTETSDSSFSWQLGGGLDYQFHENFRVRAVQLGLLHTNFFDNGETHLRIGAGLVYQFGGR